MSLSAEDLAMLEENETPAAPPPPKETVSTAAAPARPLETFIDGDQLKKDVAINFADLDSAMSQHASLYLHYAGMTVQARRQYDRLKNAFEILEAKLDAHYRTEFGNEGKKITEGAIRQALVADARWSSAQARVIEAGSIWRMCEVAENSFNQRKDMILEIARDRRKEREGQMRVNELSGLKGEILDQIARSKAA